MRRFLNRAVMHRRGEVGACFVGHPPQKTRAAHATPVLVQNPQPMRPHGNQFPQLHSDSPDGPVADPSLAAQAEIVPVSEAIGSVT